MTSKPLKAGSRQKNDTHQRAKSDVEILRATMSQIEPIARRQLQMSDRMSDAILHRVKELATAGDPIASYALATWHLFGTKFETENVRKNFARAAVLLRAAASKNHRDAIYDLAVCYERGRGAKKSLPMALRLYLKAARLGDRASAEAAGRMYYHGLGTRKNLKLADHWLDQAEAGGDG